MQFQGETMPYDQLLLHQNLAALQLWPWPLLVFVVAEAAQLHFSGGYSTVHTFIAVTACLCCLALAKEIESRRKNLLLIRSMFLAIGCLQFAVCINYTRGKDSLHSVHLYFDIFTNLYVATPQLVMGLNGLPVEAYILFIGCHVASAFLLYFHIAKMSWYFAALRALGVHTLPVFAALMVHKRARDFIRISHQSASLQHESTRNAESAKQSSTTVAHTPLACQVVSWPALSTKVVRHLLSLLRQRRSTLHTDSSLTPQGAQAGSTSNREPQGDAKLAQHQAPCTLAQAQAETQGKQQQHAQVQAQAEPEVHQEQRWVKQAKQQQQQQQAQQQQRHREGASGKGNSAAGQEQALSRPVDCTQQGASNSMATHQTHKTFYSSNPALQKAISKAAQVLEQRRNQEKLYASKLDTQCSRQEPKSALQSVQESCRLIIKLSGPAAPHQVPKGRLEQLQHKLRKYQCLAPTVRSGCLVVSFDTAPVNPACSLEEMSQAVLAEAKEWAQEQGLLEPGEDLLTVQACRSIYWDSMLNGQSPPVYSMTVHTPFLIPNTDGLASASSTQKQQQNDHAEMDDAMGRQGHAGCKAPECVQEEETSCEFELTICAPEGQVELRGWQGAADAPEELPEAVNSRSLCLLASLEGHFLGVTVQKESLGKNGERVVQVCVSLPADLDTCLNCPRPLMLELWAEGSIVCSYSAMLVPPSFSACAAALEELQGWAAGLTSTLSKDSGPFTRDLVRWMRFQATTQQQQEQQQEEAIAAKDAAPSDEAMQQHLELMAAVGVDLLEFSLSRGMEGVAGLLLECFASFPFSLPPLALLETRSPLSELQLLGTEEEATGEKKKLFEEAAHGVPEDQSGAPRTSTRHSSTQLNGYLHSCPSPAASTLNTSYTAAAPTTTPTFASSASSAVYYKLAAVARSLHAQHFKEKNADFNAWTSSQVSPLARIWCRVWLLGIGVGALRMALTERVPPILEISSSAPVLLAYTAGAMFIQPRSHHSELILAAISIARSSFGFMLGSGILPLSGTQKLMLRARSEVPAEIIMMSIMERVRFSWMVPLRALMAVSLWLLYRRLGLPWPATQSVLVNLCSLGVGAAMEQRYRRLYSSPRMLAKQQASAESGVGHSPVKAN